MRLSKLDYFWMIKELEAHFRNIVEAPDRMTDRPAQELTALRIGVSSRTIRRWKTFKYLPCRANRLRIKRAYYYYIKGDYKPRAEKRNTATCESSEQGAGHDKARPEKNAHALSVALTIPKGSQEALV